MRVSQLIVSQGKTRKRRKKKRGHLFRFDLSTFFFEHLPFPFILAPRYQHIHRLIFFSSVLPSAVLQRFGPGNGRGSSTLYGENDSDVITRYMYMCRCICCNPWLFWIASRGGDPSPSELFSLKIIDSNAICKWYNFQSVPK